MKHSTPLVSALLAISALATSCKPASSTPPTGDSPVAVQTPDQTKPEIQTAAPDANDHATANGSVVIPTLVHPTQPAAKTVTPGANEYTYANRAEFLSEKRAALADINKTLGELDDQVDKGADAVKEDAQPKLIALHEQAAALKSKLDAADDATEATWNDTSADVEKRFVSLNTSFNETRKSLSIQRVL